MRTLSHKLTIFDKTQYFYTMIDNTTFIKYNNTNIFFKKEMMSWTPVPYAKLLFC